MVKKIAKYSKFVLCIALILSLVAPSYAALSASDGSAFVTKAEFDSALADFNARLTTFEAGINSKIDSQVTSYLDRNGIWNGKDCGIDNTVYVPIPIKTLSGAAIDNTFTFSNVQTGYGQAINEPLRFDTLFECPKSGLLLFSMYSFGMGSLANVPPIWQSGASAVSIAAGVYNGVSPGYSTLTTSLGYPSFYMVIHHNSLNTVTGSWNLELVFGVGIDAAETIKNQLFVVSSRWEPDGINTGPCYSKNWRSVFNDLQMMQMLGFVEKGDVFSLLSRVVGTGWAQLTSSTNNQMGSVYSPAFCFHHAEIY